MTINALKDGKPNVFSYIDGARMIRIEIDNDEDGKIDRWEYYGDDQKILKVGIFTSERRQGRRVGFRGSDGTIAKDRSVDKARREGQSTEFYEKGKLTRAEEDADGDGLIDKWETYEADVWSGFRSTR